MISINYKATRTVARMMASAQPVRVIAGPIGSGKTTGVIFEILRRAVSQAPAPDKIRYTRWAIVRQTFEQLRMTILKDLEQWFGKIGRYKVQDKTFTIAFGDVHCELILIPLEDPEDQKRLLSSQLTGAWMSECIEMSVELVGPLLGRCGRYPSAAQGGATWYGVICDTNMPSEGSGWHAKMTHEKPPEWDVFIQPGGFEEDAENLEYLVQTPETLKLPPDDYRRREQGRKYYVTLLASYNEDAANRYIHAKFGADPSGSAVFRASFKRGFHVVDNLEPVQGRPLIVCQDFGRNPWGLITQVDHQGRYLILEEIEAQDMGLAVHVATNLRPALLQERYITLSSYIVGDPSGIQRGAVYEDSSYAYLKRENFNAYPAPTNDIDKRIAAVDQWLVKRYGGQPALLIDGSRCPKLVQAMSGNYRYAKRKSGELAPSPEKKHPWSDVADCLQYGCLVAGSGMGDMIATRQMRTAVARQLGDSISRRATARTRWRGAV